MGSRLKSRCTIETCLVEALCFMIVVCFILLSGCVILCHHLNRSQQILCFKGGWRVLFHKKDFEHNFFVKPGT